MECPANRSKSNYKVCGHCYKELNVKIYKDHKSLYYVPVNKSWVQDVNCDAQHSDQSRGDFSSIDDIDLCSSDIAIQGEHRHSGDSDFLWEEPYASSTPENTDKGTCSSVINCHVYSCSYICYLLF